MRRGLRRIRTVIRFISVMPALLIFGGADVGWAGAFAPMIVGEATLNELRNLAGPPSYPGQKMVSVNLVTGEFRWQTRPRRNNTYSSRRKGTKR